MTLKVAEKNFVEKYELFRKIFSITYIITHRLAQWAFVLESQTLCCNDVTCREMRENKSRFNASMLQ